MPPGKLSKHLANFANGSKTGVLIVYPNEVCFQ